MNVYIYLDSLDDAAHQKSNHKQQVHELTEFHQDVVFQMFRFVESNVIFDEIQILDLEVVIVIMRDFAD